MPQFSETAIFKPVLPKEIVKIAMCPDDKTPLAAAPFDEEDCGYSAVCPKCYKAFIFTESDTDED